MPESNSGSDRPERGPRGQFQSVPSHTETSGPLDVELQKLIHDPHRRASWLQCVNGLGVATGWRVHGPHEPNYRAGARAGGDDRQGSRDKPGGAQERGQRQGGTKAKQGLSAGDAHRTDIVPLPWEAC